MPRVEFEPTIPAFEQAKTVHALDWAAAMIGRSYIQNFIASRSIFYVNGILREDMFLCKFVMSMLRSSKIKDGWHWNETNNKAIHPSTVGVYTLEWTHWVSLRSVAISSAVAVKEESTSPKNQK
jgi:hypothetical protein